MLESWYRSCTGLDFIDKAIPLESSYPSCLVELSDDCAACLGPNIWVATV